MKWLIKRLLKMPKALKILAEEGLSKPRPFGIRERIAEKARVLDTDSYKAGHWKMYPKDTEVIYSYFEARKGSQYDNILWFGLQYYLLVLEEAFCTDKSYAYAKKVMAAHFGSDFVMNKKDWQYIRDTYGDKLPLTIKAAPEGLVVKPGTVLMTVENTDYHLGWLTNYLETFLSRVYYTMTVATVSFNAKLMIWAYLEQTGCTDIYGTINFMLHDFGSRGVSCQEQAGLGGMAHLVNFLGSDTMVAIPYAEEVYGADPTQVCYSVYATEHSIMTSRGREGEEQVVEDILNEVPSDMILSMVVDSYDSDNFTSIDGIAGKFKDKILGREGRTVFRPDSGDPVDETLKIMDNLWQCFGGDTNEAGFKVLNPKIRCLWGDGIDVQGIDAILFALADQGYAAENMVFGMGGALLMKVNRDTCHCAFKCSARYANGEWIEIYKDPKTAGEGSAYYKGSKRGRMKLVIVGHGEYETICEGDEGYAEAEDLLQEVFVDGKVYKKYSWGEVKERAALHHELLALDM